MQQMRRKREPSIPDVQKPPQPNYCCGLRSGDAEQVTRKRVSRILARQHGAVETNVPHEAPEIVGEVVRSTGKPLDPDTRSFFEQRFNSDFSRVPVHGSSRPEVPGGLPIGTPEDVFERQAGMIANEVMMTPAPGKKAGHEEKCDLSRVRLHDDSKAAESARKIEAAAYTVGKHLVFGAAQYAPTTFVGRRLLAHELAHVVQQSSAAKHTPGMLVQREAKSPPTSERVWGLPITRSMCGCRARVRDGISWANTAGATYAACDIPANPTSTDVENCFDAAHPGTTVAGSTSPSGTMTLPAPSADPCQRIDDKATFVHETMHSRHANDIARAQGAAFYLEWRRLAGDPNRLGTLRATFPTQVAAFEAQWQDGHDWAQDEVNSYRWERRFLVDTLRALNRIC